MIAREYQTATVEAVHTELYTKGLRSTLVVNATGTGKSFIMAELIKRTPKRAMALMDRKKLVRQNAKTFRDHTGEVIGIEMGELRTRHLMREKAICSTVQSLSTPNRLEQFDPMEFDLLMIDECHHATSPQFRRIIDYFSVNSELKIVGVTATADRGDSEALGQIFESVAFEYPLLKAIDEGWLVYPYHRLVEVAGLDFSHIRTTAGDLNGADLAAVMEREESVMKMIHASLEVIYGMEPETLSGVEPTFWRDYIDDYGHAPKRTLAFTVSVKHAEMMSEIFNRIIPGISQHVHGKTPDDLRERIENDFYHGEIPIVCNCGLYLEGYDNPAVEVGIMGKPTKSRARYAQMVGRFTRTLPNVTDGFDTPEGRKLAIAASKKPSSLIVDFTGNCGKHKLVSMPDLLGGIISEQVKLRIAERAKKGRVHVGEAIEEEKEREFEERRQAEAAKKARLVARTSFSTQEINPFDILQIKPQKPFYGHDGKVLAPGHLASLEKNFKGIDVKNMHYSQQMQLLKQVWARQKAGYCTFNMMKILGQRGYDAKKMSFQDASNLLTEISTREGWKR